MSFNHCTQVSKIKYNLLPFSKYKFTLLISRNNFIKNKCVRKNKHKNNKKNMRLLDERLSLLYIYEFVERQVAIVTKLYILQVAEAKVFLLDIFQAEDIQTRFLQRYIDLRYSPHSEENVSSDPSRNIFNLGFTRLYEFSIEPIYTYIQRKCLEEEFR